MLPIKKILSPTDFSGPAEEGYKNARILAEHFGAQLVVVHVITPVPTIPDGHGVVYFDAVEYKKATKNYAKSRLDEFIARAEEKGIPTTGFVTEGDAAREIVRAADDHEADLIVIATHGHSGWKNFVTGSVTEKVVRTSRRPVLTVRKPEEEE